MCQTRIVGKDSRIDAAAWRLPGGMDDRRIIRAGGSGQVRLR
jgi:hypothetical protein